MSNVRRFLITLAGAIALGCGGLIALAGVTAAPASAAPSCSEPPSIECTFSYTGGIQSFQVPTGVTVVEITASGAQGGGGVLGVPGGMGAELKGYFGVTPGATVNVVVGGEGTSLNGTGGGGGASFVYTGSGASAHLMMAAAGGGGSAGDSPGSGGSATPTADDGQPVSEVPGGPGGTDGNGGSICCQVFGEPGPGGGGGGLLTNGQDYANSMGMSGGGGKALVNGAGGGAGLPGYGNGGFGGGGGAGDDSGAGGGGYNGGGSGGLKPGGLLGAGGGGGGSENSGNAQFNEDGVQPDNGEVVISSESIAAPPPAGYRLVARDGGVFSFIAPFYGSMGGQALNQPMVGMASDYLTGGYWEVASDGGIFAFNAPFEDSMAGQHLNQPIVGMAPTPDGQGYWEVARDGASSPSETQRSTARWAGSRSTSPSSR